MFSTTFLAPRPYLSIIHVSVSLSPSRLSFASLCVYVGGFAWKSCEVGGRWFGGEVGGDGWGWFLLVTEMTSFCCFPLRIAHHGSGVCCSTVAADMHSKKKERKKERKGKRGADKVVNVFMARSPAHRLLSFSVIYLRLCFTLCEHACQEAFVYLCVCCGHFSLGFSRASFANLNTREKRKEKSQCCVQTFAPWKRGNNSDVIVSDSASSPKSVSRSLNLLPRQRIERLARAHA